MTMSSSAGGSPYPRVEELPAVTSGGSCSVISNNEVGSVGSGSTKTRFSFYNAEEVEEQIIQNNSSNNTNNPNNSPPKKDAPKSLSAGDGGGIPVPDKPLSPPSVNNNNNPLGSAIIGTSNTNEHQRFNFYIAGGGDHQQQEDKDKTEDDRRSPHTLLVTEDTDNKRTPAVSSTTTTSETAAAKPSSAVAVGIKPSLAAATPQRSNNSLASSAQKKKQRAVAAARARNHHSKASPNPSRVAAITKSAGHHEEEHSNMDSVEILRSLKDTEQMRYNLMKECHPQAPSNNNNNNITNKHHHHQLQHQHLSSASSVQSDNNSSQETPLEIFQDAAENFPAEPATSTSSQPYTIGRTPTTQHNFYNSIQHTGGVGVPSVHGPSSKLSNPYEDAIREALDLLRRHRPASPGQHQLEPTTGHGTGNAMAGGTSSADGGNAAQTPRDADRVLQSRWESPLQNQEEFDSRRKERQERMARYTSRLAELKNGEDVPVNPATFNRPAASTPIEEEEDRSILSSLPSNSMDPLVVPASSSNPPNLASSASFQSQPQQQQLEQGGLLPSSSNLGPSASFQSQGGIIQTSSLSPQHQQRQVQVPLSLSSSLSQGGADPHGDLASQASSLSASHYNPQHHQQGNINNNNNPKEVHRSVERVLLAILERAHSNGRGHQAATIEPSASHLSHYSIDSTQSANKLHRTAPAAQPDVGLWQGEEKKSPSEDQLVLVPSSSLPTPQVAAEDDPLLRAVGELLSSSGGGGSASVMSSASQQQHANIIRPASEGSSTHYNSSNLDQASLASGTKRSVVEELLAEAESFGEQQQHEQQSVVDDRRHLTSSSGNSSLDDNKTAEDLLNCSTGVEAVRSDADADAVTVDKELDDLVLKTLGKSSSSQGAKKNKDSSRSRRADDEDDDDDHSRDDDYDDDDDSRSRSDSYDGGEENDDSYGDDGDDDDSEDELDDALEGVLGPLSKGTTGVVLESNLSPDRSSGERSLFDSLSNAMSSLVASAISGDEKQALQSSSKSSSGRDKYATDMDKRDHDGEDAEEIESIDQSGSSDEEVDEEASELMRSLCAHLLPFGVDQSSRFLDEVPQWDDSNPNEAGYRIIRLTSQQLQRVERAFAAMVHGLKKNSEQNLIASSQPEGSPGDLDDTFERDLAVAEKVLDREEENRSLAIKKALNVGTPKDGEITVTIPDPTSTESDAESDTDGPCDKDTAANTCHPTFPGVHSAGKGEMGDLEYFHLPVIFKSHVTGFEPTKDLYLEPGNVVAGQYLVESELGSAAFSTAYRCVDLNSEGDDTEDGHQEVCLKVIKNTKDFFDQSLDEIKILELLRQTGKCHQNHIIEMKTFFYHREHLIIVTELLRQNLFEFGKFILDHDEEPYFTLPRLSFITRQCLTALRYVHKLGLVHSDVKPENILLGSYSRAQVKLIDFGSSCYLTDRQSSYIQSRSYRAPEVVLGLPYDGKIDVWSLGCVVAEMLTGEVTFQNDSIVSMLSRIEAICGPFPRHMIAQGRQSCRFFTKCGLLFEKVKGGEGQKTPDVSEDEDEDDDSDVGGRGGRSVFDIFQPKVTSLSSRLGFSADLHERYTSGASLSALEERQAQFVDFVKKLLTIDPDSRPSASEALKHPWMLYAATLTEENIKYPSS